MNYNNTIDYLYSLQKHGIKLGLENIKRLLSSFGNPQDYFPSVHVAGTNGKGSTSAMIASILQAAGLRVGLFTSPHLISFTERIRVNNEEITEYEVIELADEIRLKVESLKLEVKDSTFNLQPSAFHIFEPTFFEFITAMAFIYFGRKKVDWAVIETGMGGRLDATNILSPEVSVITNVNYDHKEFLGDTISAIAGEKAGIIKSKIPVVTSSQETGVLDVIERAAKEKGSDVYVYNRDFSSELRACSVNGCVFDYYGDRNLGGLKINLPGKHQVLNASLALKAAEVLIKRAAPHASRLTTQALESGIRDARWHGRLEFVSDNPPIVIDGAHNPSAAGALADSLREIFLKEYNRLILIIGIMSDKDISGIMKPLVPLASEIILTAPAYERAASPQKLAECASTMGYFNVHVAQTVRDAIEMAKDMGSWVRGQRAEGKKALPLILITGSFYTIGEVKEVLGTNGVLSRLRETR